MGNFPILSLITFLPVVGMIAILCIPTTGKKVISDKIGKFAYSFSKMS